METDDLVTITMTKQVAEKPVESGKGRQMEANSSSGNMWGGSFLPRQREESVALSGGTGIPLFPLYVSLSSCCLNSRSLAYGSNERMFSSKFRET